jgi:hypothetical protein
MLGGSPLVSLEIRVNVSESGMYLLTNALFAVWGFACAGNVLNANHLKFFHVDDRNSYDMLFTLVVPPPGVEEIEEFRRCFSGREEWAQTELGDSCKWRNSTLQIRMVLEL